LLEIERRFISGFGEQFQFNSISPSYMTLFSSYRANGHCACLSGLAECSADSSLNRASCKDNQKEVSLMSIRQAVRLVLSQFEECRNDDLLLFAEVLPLCPGANPTTITRYRAYFQNDLGWFKPTNPDALEKRNRHKRRSDRQQ
jgi:hypothetical protein